MESIAANSTIMQAGAAIESSPFLLSLCIPTYNRAQALDVSLKNIIDQPAFDHRTEVVVVDNNSSDDTQKIVEKYTAQYPNIVYYKNAENIGMEKNIIRALECGRGKLLKSWNDYCFFGENKLAELLSLIERNTDEEAILYFHNKPGAQAELTCTDLNVFFRETTYWITWIGSFSIWNKDLKAFKETSQFEGLLFPHVLMLLKAFENKKKIKIVYGTFFYGLPGIRKGGYDFYQIFVENFIGKIIRKIYDEKKIDAGTLHRIEASFINKFLSKWMAEIVFSKSHSFNNKNISLPFKYFKFYPQFYILLLKLAFHPVVKASKQGVKKLFPGIAKPVTGSV